MERGRGRQQWQGHPEWLLSPAQEQSALSQPSLTEGKEVSRGSPGNTAMALEPHAHCWGGSQEASIMGWELGWEPLGKGCLCPPDAGGPES